MPEYPRDTWRDTPHSNMREGGSAKPVRSGIDEATKIVHSSPVSMHRGDDPLVHHNPSGGTGYQEGPRRENPTGATVSGYADMPSRENPCGETVSGYADMPHRINPGGGESGAQEGMPIRNNPLGDSSRKPTGVDPEVSQRKNPS